jgi:hypothetical protein
MPVRIIDVREITQSISSPIRNAYIDFSKMTSSLVAVVTNVERDGCRVIGYGFNSNPKLPPPGTRKAAGILGFPREVLWIVGM